MRLELRLFVTTVSRISHFYILQYYAIMFDMTNIDTTIKQIEHNRMAAGRPTQSVERIVVSFVRSCAI